MKIWMIGVWVVSCAFLRLSANEIGQNDEIVSKYRERVQNLSRGRHYSIGYQGEDQITIFRKILADAKTNGVSENAVYGMAEDIVAEIEGEVSSNAMPRIRLLGAVNLLNLLEDTGDSSLLPYLEEKCESSHRKIRDSAAIAYVKIAGLDAVPFVRKILSTPKNQINLLTEEFLHTMENAVKTKAQGINVDNGYGLLLELLKILTSPSDIHQVDAFLCIHLCP